MAKEDQESQQEKSKTHKEWRKQAKKLRRQRIRRQFAEARNKLAAEEEAALLNDPSYMNWLREQEELEIQEHEQEERQRQEQEELWLRRELLARKLFREQKQKQEATLAIKEAERLKIQKDFEELQQKIQKRKEERDKLEEQAKREHEEMMQKICDYIELGGPIPEELKSNIESNPDKPTCSFYTKTNACRFGPQCKKNHIRPRLSRMLFFPNFFQDIKLNYKGSVMGSDVLECEDKDLDDDYKVFFDDVTEELKKFGEIRLFGTCMNIFAHLRGNVLVEYSSKRDALKAYVQLQRRFYAGTQIKVQFSSLTASTWNGAICGLSSSNRCPKGKTCNFMHVFKNPGNLYTNPNYKQNNNNQIIEHNSRKETKETESWNDDKEDKRNRDWRWSESPEPSSNKSKHYNDSRDSSRRNREESRERHRSFSTKHKRNRTRSRSRDRSSSRSVKISKRSKDRKGRKSKSNSPSHSRKHHKKDDREKHHKTHK